jgi:hypothetical protein
MYMAVCELYNIYLEIPVAVLIQVARGQAATSWGQQLAGSQGAPIMVMLMSQGAPSLPTCSATVALMPSKCVSPVVALMYPCMCQGHVVPAENTLRITWAARVDQPPLTFIPRCCGFGRYTAP